MAPYEALYGRKCRSPICWDEVGERLQLGPEMVQETAEKVDEGQGTHVDSSESTEKLCISEATRARVP